MINVASIPWTEAERELCLSIFEQTDNVSETARRLSAEGPNKRSKQAVSRIVAQAGGEPSGRRFTQKARQANVEDAKARRARLAVLWREAEEETLSRALRRNDDGKYHFIKGTGSGQVIDRRVSDVPADDMKHLLTGAAIASDKAAILEKVDTPTDGQGRGLLEELVGTLREKRGKTDG